jgi:hypothetical protein
MNIRDGITENLERLDPAKLKDEHGSALHAAVMRVQQDGADDTKNRYLSFNSAISPRKP